MAESLGVHLDTITDWLKLYSRYGLERYCSLQYDGRRMSKLEPLKTEIKQYVNSQYISTINQLQDYLLDNYNLYVEHSWLYRFCKKNSIYLIKKQG